MTEKKPRAEGARRYGPALERTYQFFLWLVPTLDKFPRSQRFPLGDRIEAAARSSAALARSEVQGNLLGE
jgi:hypothetical protein